MSDPKPKIARFWNWARLADGADFAPADRTVLKEHQDQNVSWLETAKLQQRERYETDLFEEGLRGPFPAVVLKVLSGPSAANEASTGGTLTKTASTKANRTWWEQFSFLEGKLSPVRVIARPLTLKGAAPGAPLNGGIPAPWDLPKSASEKEIEHLISLHPEFVALKSSSTKSKDLAGVQPGTPIWVDFPAGTASPVRANGILVDTIKNYVPMPAEVIVSPEDAHNPKCKTTGGLPLEEGFYAGHTIGLLSEGPLISKVKNKIKTGVYGPGSIQTKAHFLESLSIASGPSPLHGILGSAPGINNSFLWVGNLRQNGYLDSVDRPCDDGRETIIYAPKTLDIDSPVEIKYYLHDAGGFGFPWINGPTTNEEDARASAALKGNDFKEKIAPMIKDMSRSGRNYVLVIPELMHSRGYGTGLEDHMRAVSIRWGKKTKSGISDGESVRSFIDRASTSLKSEISKHLSRMKVMSAKVESLASVQRFKHRYMSSFDNSFTGGNFAKFHGEVLSVLSEQFGAGFASRVSGPGGYVSVVADGYAVLSFSRILAEELSSITNLRRIDFINPGGLDRADPDTPWNLQFEQKPATQYFYENFISIFPAPLEFNYISVHPATPDAKLFFKKQGKASQFEKSSKKVGQGFSYYIGNSSAGKYITSHMYKGKNKGAEYAFKMSNTSLMGEHYPFPKKPMSAQLPIKQSTPDHAASISSKKHDAAILAYSKLKDSLKENTIEPFETLLMKMQTMTLAEICKEAEENNLPHFAYCKAGGTGERVIFTASGSLFATRYSAWLNAKEKVEELNKLEEFELEMKEVRDGRGKIKDLKDKYTKLKTDSESTMPTANEALKKYSTYNQQFFATPNAMQLIQISSLRFGSLAAAKKALARIQEYEKSQETKKAKPPSECGTPSVRLSSYDTGARRSPGADQSGDILCESMRLVRPTGPGAYQALAKMIPFYPKKEDYIGSKNNRILSDAEGYDLSGFKYLSRQPRGKIDNYDSSNDGVRVWKCLAPILESGFKEATARTSWAPVKVTHGFRQQPPPRMTNSVSLHSYGLAIDIDPCMNGWDNKGELTAVVFTNGYNPRLLKGTNLEEVHDLGIYAESMDDLKRNIRYLGTGDLRAIRDYSGAPTVWQPGDTYGGYFTKFALAEDASTKINPSSSNPLLWVITFCEETQMIWGNGTFLRRRFRGGVDWSETERQRIDEIFNIPDVVNRVRKISWNSSVNDYMHFHWWHNKNVISFEEIKKAAEANGVTY